MNTSKITIDETETIFLETRMVDLRMSIIIVEKN